MVTAPPAELTRRPVPFIVDHGEHVEACYSMTTYRHFYFSCAALFYKLVLFVADVSSTDDENLCNRRGCKHIGVQRAHLTALDSTHT